MLNTTPLYRIFLMFEWGGGCLWCGNEVTLEKFDVGSLAEVLPLSTSIREQLDKLSAWHDQALNWSNPADVSPWNEDEFELFENAANAMRVQLQAELGADFEFVYVPLGKS